jgi:hypothetical protein
VECLPNRRNNWPDCADDIAWAKREALTFIAQIEAPYQCIQTQDNHVQPDVSHAVNMVNAAVNRGVPWVRGIKKPGQSPA